MLVTPVGGIEVKGVGDKLESLSGGAEVVAIDRNRVVLRCGKQDVSIELEVDKEGILR
jgi:hypothetical protein